MPSESPYRGKGLEGKKTCRIAYQFNNMGIKSDESEWAEIQEKMVDAMIRLEKALILVIGRLGLNK